MLEVSPRTPPVEAEVEEVAVVEVEEGVEVEEIGWEVVVQFPLLLLFLLQQ